MQECEKEARIRLWSDLETWKNASLTSKPKEGDDVTILCPWNLKIDEPIPKFNKLEINGNLIFDETLPETVIEANYIWVRVGKLIAGSKEKPF